MKKQADIALGADKNSVGLFSGLLTKFQQQLMSFKTKPAENYPVILNNALKLNFNEALPETEEDVHYEKDGFGFDQYGNPVKW